MKGLFYKALNRKGRILRGYSRIKNEEELALELRRKNYYLILCRARKFKQKKVNYKDLYVFSAQLSYMLNAGFNICESFDILHDKFKGVMKDNIMLIRNEIENGKSFYESLKTCDISFPHFFVEMLGIGEQGGHLVNVLDHMSAYYENIYGIKEKIKNILIYPSLVLFISIILMIFLIIDIIPKFSMTLTSLGGQLPYITCIIMQFGLFIKKNIFFILMFFTIAIFFIIRIQKIYYIRSIRDQLKFKIPFIKNIYKKEIAKRFTCALSILLGSETNLIEAMNIAARVTENIYSESVINGCIKDMKNGMSIGESFEKSNIFPSFTIDMFTMAEESGNLEVILKKTSELYQNEIENQIKRGVGLIEPTIMVIISVIIGIIVISVMLPVINIMNSIH